MAVEIRNATVQEATYLVATYEWLFAPPGAQPPQWDPERAAERLRAAVDSEQAAVLIAVHDGETVGLCTAYEDMVSVRFGPRVWVEDLAVHPDHRSLGIGKRLLDAAKAWARDRGASHLELDSGENRPDAHRFYEREQPSWRSICFGWEL
jgi:GNAT superfamily N-acetyltransferase